MAYNVRIYWQKDQHERFTDKKYSRAHTWYFDGGVEIAASSSPHVVPVPMSDATAVDPEEAFIAAIASCHMLWFLSIAAGKGLIVDRYEDLAEGVLARNEDGRLAMTRVTLKPAVYFPGEGFPARAAVDEIHHLAHEKCFIANSVKTSISIVPTFSTSD